MLAHEVHQLAPHLLQQRAVRRMGDVLFHHGGIRANMRKAAVHNDSAACRALNDSGQQPFHAFLTQTVTPLRHGRRIDRGLVLEMRFAAEVLVVRIRDPKLHETLIRQRFHMLEHQKARDLPAGTRHAATRTAVQRTPAGFEQFPLHRVRHADQGMLPVNEVDQRGACVIEELVLPPLRRRICLGLHGPYPYCKKLGPY